MEASRFYESVAAELACDRERAEALTLVVFQELRDRLTAEESRDLAAQLPLPLQRVWREGEIPERTPQKMHAHEFIERVRKRGVLPDDAEANRAVRAVFRTLRVLLGSPGGLTGEAWDVFSVLPKDMKLLWLDVGPQGT